MSKPYAGRSRFFLAAVAATAVATGWAVSSVAAKPAANSITIGLIGPLTGSSAADGDLMVKGAELAIDEINSAGGIDGYQFKLKTEDTQDLKPDAVASAVQQLLSDPSVGVIVTGYASANNFEIDTMRRAGMPYILSGSSAQTVAIIGKNPSAYPTVWSLAPSYNSYGTVLPRKMAAWAKQSSVLSSHRVFLVTSDNPYSQSISKGMIQTFKSIGYKISGNDVVPYGAISDWGSVLAKIRAAKPSIIIDTDYLPANEAAFLDQFLQKPTNSLLFFQYGPTVPKFLQLTGKKAEGVLYDTLTGPIDSPKWKLGEALIKKFVARYHVQPGDYGADLYDQVYLYANALKTVGDPSKKAEIGAAIGAVHANVAEGPLRFDPKTHLALQSDTSYFPLKISEIWHGQKFLISPSRYSTGTFHSPPWLTK
jgi:branched-chain amino acid transport system substrate-binding protein